MSAPAFKRLGKYEILNELGRGGFGTVYRAFDPTVGRMVAIKVLMSEAGKDLLARFRNEAVATGNLRHENIVTIYEFGDDKGVSFIVMEHLEGEDLQQVLGSGRALTLLEKLHVMTQTAAGLDCAHRHGVVHRDVKPANIRLLPDGRVKIMDFGIARLVRGADAARLTRQGHLLGTLLYMAPEQLMGSECDALSDIFAYGVTAYELLTGRHPFHAEDPRSVFYKITSEDPEPIHELAPDCPEMLDHVIRRALHKERELRYQTLRDLRVDVEPVLIALRQERAAELADSARRFAGEGSFEQALGLLNEAIDLDSTHGRARELRDSVQKELQRRLVRPRIEALLAKAERLLADDNHNDAVQAIETAMQLDPNDSSLQARSREAQQRRDQARESRRLTAEARADFGRGSLASALQKASEAIALSPKSSEARGLLESVQAEIHKRERRNRLQEKIRNARELLLVNSLDEASAVMESLEAEERETPEAVDLFARATARRREMEREQRLARQLATAGALLGDGHFAAALQSLQELRTECPDEPRLEPLLIEARRQADEFERSQAIEKLQEAALRLAGANRFEEADALVESGLREYPADAGVLRLRDAVLLARTEWERQQAIERTVSRCHALAGENRFDEALLLVRETHRIYPEENALERLDRELEAGRRRRREEALAEAVADARQLAQSREFERALDLLDAAAERWSAHGELTTVQSEIAAGQADWIRRQKVGAAVERAQSLLSAGDYTEAARVAAEALRDYPGESALAAVEAEAKVRKLLSLHDFDAARRLLDTTDQACGSDQRLAALRAELANAEAAWLSEQELAAAIAQCERLCAAEKYAEAVDSADTALALHPGAPGLVAARQAALRGLEEQRRATEIADCLAHAAELTALGRPEEAAQSLDAAISRLGPDPALKAALADARAKTAAKARAEIAAAVAQCERLCAARNYAEAVDSADTALALHPGAPGLVAARQAALRGLEEQRRATETADCLAHAAELTALGRPEEAAQSLDAAISRLGPDPALKAALADARAKAAAKERAEIGAAIAQCERLCAAGKYAEAVDSADTALALHPGAPGQVAARQAALRGLEEQRRATEIADCLAHAAELTALGRPEEAAQSLDAAISRLGPDPALKAALADARAKAAAKERAEAITTAAAHARSEANRGRFVEALAALDALEQDWGKDEMIEVARDAVRSAQAAVEREKEAAERESARRAEALRAGVREAVRQCEALIAAGDLAKAGRALQNAMREFPNARELAAVQQTIKAEWDRRRRAEATRRAAENARSLLDRGQTARAIQLLEAAAVQYPGDPVIKEVLTLARGARGDGNQEDVVETVCRETRLYLETNDFDRALKTVTSNLETRAGDRRLIALRETVIAAQREFERGGRKRRAAPVAQAVTDDPAILTQSNDHPPGVDQFQPTPWSPEAAVPQPGRSRRIALRGRKGALAAVASVLALAAVVAGSRALRSGAGTIALTVETEPADAAVQIDGQDCGASGCSVAVPSGSHRVDARLPGYAPASQTTNVTKDAASRLKLVLVPLPTSLVVTSNFSGGVVELDGKNAGALTDGQIALELQPGSHQLRIAGPDGEISFAFRAGVAQRPDWSGQIAARGADAIVVSSLGSSVRAACSHCEGEPLVDGKPLGGRTIEAGAHEISARLQSGDVQRALIRTTDVPTIAIHLSSATSVNGALLVETNVNGAIVLLDRLGERRMDTGRLVIPLEPRDYRIQLRKPGYRVTPDHVIARIRKGDQYRAEFRLDPIPSANPTPGALESVKQATPPAAIGFKEPTPPAPRTPTIEAPPPTVKPPAPPTAEEVEALEWATARSARDQTILQAFLQKHPDSAHRQEALRMLEQLEWDALDRKDRAALERFSARYRGTPLAEQANAEIARIEREAAAGAAKREQDQIGADRSEISRVLTVYASAFEMKDLALLKTVWPSLPEAALAQAFRGKGGIRSQLRSLAPAEFAGDHATIRCVRVTEQTTQFGRQKPVEEPRTVRLRKQNGSWIISSID